MKLPNNEIGISDILQHRDCPRRMEFGMRRHDQLPDELATHPGQKDEPPEHTDWTNAYGSAVHDMIELSEQNPLDDEAAVQEAFRRYSHWLDPEDLQLLREDLEKYQARDYVGVETVMSEQDARVPLFVHEGVQIYFRFKVDRLYRRLDGPTTFISVDYKSSKWAKSAEEVHNDLQQWSYNWGLFELIPEMENLTQIYDQLRYGQTPTSKNDQQRDQIRRWLIAQVKTILADDEMEPVHNQWCPWCPIMYDCPVVRRLSDWSVTRIGALAPEKKVGRKIVVELDAEHISSHVELMPKADNAQKVLKRYVDEVRSTLKAMDSEQRAALGYELRNRKQRKFTPTQLRQAASVLGDDFFQVASISKTALEEFYGKGDETPMDRVLALADEVVGAEYVQEAK